MSFLRSPKLVVAYKSLLAGSVLGCLALGLAVRQTFFKPLSPTTHPLFKSPFYKAFNPNNNCPLYDSCVRRIRLSELRPELVEDAHRGGTKLIEKFSAGVWGGWGFGPQRNIALLLQKDESSPTRPWHKNEILNNTFEEGTIVSGEFIVLNKSPTSILFRGGEPARELNNELRAIDVLAEISVSLDFEKDVAEFKFNSIFFQGKGHTSSPPFPDFVTALHRLYARALVQSGVAHCVR